jgi:BirA family transcriptional regulator, biotin operon repressor / biotin---[acetyl-CoA-carboxylase] ligase
MSDSWTRLDRPPLRQAALRRALTDGDERGWRALDVVPRTGSTNADLAARARDGEAAGLVLTADDQVAGRGRLAREWTAPPRSSIAVSVLVAPQVPVARWGWLPLLTGLAVVRALTRTAGLPAVLKWPNDVLVPVGGRSGDGAEELKVCGILAETVRTPSGAAAIVGIGLNVSQDAAELPVPTATSLRLAGAATTDRDTLLRAVLRRLAIDLAAWEGAGGDPRASGIGAGYREACATIGRRVAVHLPGREPLIGICEGVDDDGRLLVRDDAGRDQVLAAGDVVHVRPGPSSASADASPS